MTTAAASAYQRNYRQANKERIAAQQKAYREANITKMKRYVHNRPKSERRKQEPSHMSDVHLPMDDKLLDQLDVPLNEDQTLYLLGHRHEKRTNLAKKLGIMKLQLCYKLEKLERTGSL